jgi:sulfite exporter TauE/SafE
MFHPVFAFFQRIRTRSVLVSELTIPALFVAGLGSSMHCALMCGAVGARSLNARGSVPRKQAMALIHGGRMVGYMALGALSGALGGQLISLLPDQRLGQGLQLAAALTILATGLIQLRAATSHRQVIAACCAIEPKWLAAAPHRLRLFIRGLLWSAMPCSILYGTLAIASLSGGAWAGGALLGAFALGTVPILGASNITFSALGATHGAKSLRYAAAFLLLGLGVSSLTVILTHSNAALAWCHTTF